jgi:hypothetical protein
LINWVRTVRETFLRPGPFFDRLPLSASRRAATRFLVCMFLVAPLGVVVLFAVDWAACRTTGLVDPVLPSVGYVAQDYADFIAHAPRPGFGGGVVGQTVPLVVWTVWVTECLVGAAFIALLILMISYLLLALSAIDITGRMSSYRGRGMRPVGLLLIAYLLPRMLVCVGGVVGAVLAARLIGEAAAESLRHLHLDVESLFAIGFGILSGVTMLAWYLGLTRRAGRALRYANQ